MSYRKQSLENIYEDTLDCVHCGLCLSDCPTYRETGKETSSPRGRIYLMRSVAEGKIPLGDVIAEEAYLCLGCRACESACPSGVQFGKLVESTRAEVERARLRRGFFRTLEYFALRRLIVNSSLLHQLFSVFSIIQSLQIDRLVRSIVPGRIKDTFKLLPRIPSRANRLPLTRTFSCRGPRRGRVALFEGCIMRQLFGDVNRATARVLVYNGFDVIVPEGQTCCGALHAHAGDLDFAHGLANRNIEVFDGMEVDAIVTNSAGCGAALKDLAQWVGDSASSFVHKVNDISEFLDDVGLYAPDQSLPLRVAYDDPCHLVHGQHVEDAPRRLLSKIPDLELVSHDDPKSCCGAAGIYNLTHPKMSQAVLARKMKSLCDGAPDVIATGNPGCLMQIRAGVLKTGMKSEVLHPVELLNRAYR